MEQNALELDVQDVSIRLSYLRRPGPRPTLLCLHGFGSSKEDYADLAINPAFADRDLVVWDAPGCGASDLSDPSAPTIPFLVAVTRAACDALGLDRVHLLGHSMGGLTGLLFAQAHPDRVRSFFDEEGNLAPEDCFLSRQIFDHPADTPEAFRDAFINRVRDRAEYGSALYAAALPLKVRASSFVPIFRSMVAISDRTPLLEIIAGLPCPRAFVHGAQNSHLSYLPRLPQLGVQVVDIPHSGHFPMYSNPPALWSALAAFLETAEAT